MKGWTAIFALLACLCVIFDCLGGGEASGQETKPSGEREQSTSATHQPDRIQEVIDKVERICLDEAVPMVGRVKAVRLAELVREHKPRLIVECGTAIGYSTLWMAQELKQLGCGKIISIEILPERVERAREFLRQAGLEEFAEVRLGDARELVKQIEGPVDFLFLDCGYQNYYPCLAGIKDRLAPGAVVVADNVGIGERGMRDYLEFVRKHYKSRTEWFDVTLPWVARDAMEISVVPEK